MDNKRYGSCTSLEYALKKHPDFERRTKTKKSLSMKKNVHVD